MLSQKHVEKNLLPEISKYAICLWMDLPFKALQCIMEKWESDIYKGKRLMTWQNDLVSRPCNKYKTLADSEYSVRLQQDTFSE